jgi:hypothetical protein
MNLNCKTYIFLCLVTLSFFYSFSQGETAKWKLQLALGGNNPSSSGFAEGFYAQSFNLPTVNIGLQHMFARQFGAKLDIGFNRFKNADKVPEFKINYTRLNAQFVYDPTYDLRFLPEAMRVVFHAGPGVSFVQPLGNAGPNKTGFINVVGGSEIHYGLSKTLSVYLDGSYVLGFSSNEPSGLGAFNGDLVCITVGLSVSLSGCYYCD